MPYVEPDRKAPETPSKVEQINDFSGGLNTTINGSLLNKSEAQKAVNVSFEQKGTIVPLKGRVKRYPAPFHTAPTTGLGMLFKQDGTSHLVMASADRLYSDAPRMSYRYTEKPDWEKGTANAYASLTRTEGSVVVDAGTLGILTDGLALTGFSPFSSTAGTTYGWKFNLSRPMKAFKLRWVPLIAGTEYTLTLWEGWVDEGQTANRKVMAFKKTPLPTEINTLQTIKLTEDMLNNVTLLAGKDYVLSIHCSLANGVARYLVAGTPVKPDYVTYAGSFSIAGDLYPTTVTTTTATFYGLSLMLEYLHHEETIKDKTRFDAGVYTNLEYDDLNVGVVTHASPSLACNTLTKPLEGVLFNDFTIDSGVLNFLKTTTTNSNNKTGLLYPYCSNFRITAFPTATAFASNTELTDAQYPTIKDTGTATSFATSTTAGQFSGLKMTYYMPLTVYDREKLTKLSFTMSIAPIDATTKILVYALPAGGTELGVANTQVLVATYDPNVYRPYTLEITADPKRFVDPVTGAINLYITTDVVAKGITISAFKMNDTFVEKTVEELRAALSVGYSVAYGDGQSVSKSLSYMTGDNSIALYDKDRTTITIGAQSGAYSKAILPVLTVVTRSGLRLKRKALPVRAYVPEAGLAGTTGTEVGVFSQDVEMAVFNASIFAEGTAFPQTGSVTTFTTGTIDGTLGLRIVGRSTSTYDYLNLLRWVYTADLTYVDAIKFHARKGADHGNIMVYIKDVGVTNNTSLASLSISYGSAPTTWTEYTIDVSSLSGQKVICFAGGYFDSTGNTTSTTEYCNIRIPATVVPRQLVALTRQGVDTTASVVKTTGTHTQTVYDAGKDAVVLDVDPSQQTSAGLPGWSYGKKITIPANTVSEALTNFPLTVYLNSSNFDFSKCKPDGTDIRFTDMALNPLKFERVEHSIDKYTTLLSHMDTLLDDASENKATFVVSGTSALSTTQKKFGTASLLLGSAGTDYVKCYGGMKGVDLSKDFTIDWWEYCIAPTCTGSFLTNRAATTGSTSTHSAALLVANNGTLLYTGTGSSWNGIVGAAMKDRPVGVWVHWALVKNGTTWRSFKNGTLFWSATNSVVPGSTDPGNLTIGAWVNDQNYSGGYNAYIDELRISNVARWTDTFTPDTVPYVLSATPGAIGKYTVNVPSVSPAGTDILMFYGNPNAYNVSCEAWQDQTGKAWTYTGNAKIRPNQGLILDGSGDYLSVAHSESLTVTTDSMCIEALIRLDVNNISHTIIAKGGIGNISYPNYALGVSTSGKLICGIGFTKTASPSLSDWASLTGATTLQANTTYHVCMTRVGSTLKLYINGVLDGTKTDATVSPNDANSRNVTIGIANSGTTDPLKGVLLGLRLTKGQARYTANFTPPTSFEIDGPDVVFCSNFDTVYDQNYAMVQHMGAHLIDASGNGNNGTATGTTVVDTVFGKMLDFEESANTYVTLPDSASINQLHTTDAMTVMALVKPESFADANGTIFSKNNSWYLQAHSDGKLAIYTYDDAGLGTYYYSTSALSTADFSCVGFSRTASGSAKIHLNGAINATPTMGTSIKPASPATYPVIGAEGNNSYAVPTASYRRFDGLIGEVRLSPIARPDSWVKLESLALKNSILTIADATFEKFYATGTYEAPPMDFTAVVAPEIGTETLAKTITVPTGTSVTLEYRTSTDGVVWSAYAALPETPIAWTPYVQVKATLNANVDKTATPEFAGVTMGFKTGYYADGYWTSEVLNLAMQGLLADSIAYVIGYTPAGTSLVFETRTSPDGTDTWTNWEVTAMDDLPEASYMQYRVNLVANANLTETPVLKKTYVGYAPDFEPAGSWESPVYDLSDYDPATIELLLHNVFVDGAATTPVTTITVWVKTSYNGDAWSDWQKLDIWNKDFKYSDIAMNPFIRLKVDYASTSPKQTPYLEGLTFRENEDLKVAIWTSPAIDVSLAKSLDSGKLIASYLNGGGVLSLMTRSSPNGVDGWSPWTNVDASYTLTSPPNNFVQAKALFTGYQSKLDELVLSMDGNASVKLIGSGLSLGTDFSFTTLRDKLIIANGKDTLKKWNGITETIEDIPDAPTLKYVISHHNRVWGVDAENQSRVRYSNILDPEKWDAFDFIDFNPEDGDYITAIMKYGQNLLISKQRSMALLTGNKTSNYAVSWLESEQGCSSHKAMCQADKYVAYVAQDGIRFSDLANSIVSTERVVPDWDKINKRRLSQAAVVYWRNKLFVALPTDESLVNNVVWVYDFLRNSWSMREGWNVSTWLKFNQYGEDILLAGSSVTGQLYQVDITEYDDDVPVTYKWRSKDFHFGAPQRYKLFRNIFLDISGTSDTTTLEVDLIVDGTVTGTYTTEIPAGAGDKHTRRILPPLYGAVLGSTISLEVRGRCGIQGITIEYVPRGAIPGGDL